MFLLELIRQRPKLNQNRDAITSRFFDTAALNGELFLCVTACTARAIRHGWYAQAHVRAQLAERGSLTFSRSLP